MKTPDGQEFDGETARTASKAASAALGRVWGVVWRILSLAGGGVGKFVATVWRLFGALDAALWSGISLFARTTARWALRVAGVFVRALADVVDWLPSRAGRAYTAFSGIVLIIALLWIVDELRATASAEADIPGGALVAPVDFDDPILARIEGRYVHLSEVAASARAAGTLQEGEALTPASAFKRGLVDAYVEQRLLARAAANEGLQRDPSIARKLAAARERILAASFMEKRIADTVTDDAVKRLYDRNSDVTRLGEAVKCRHIVVATEDEARDLLAQLNAGADFGELARAHSLDRSTAPLGGATGYLTRDQMTPVFAAAAFSTPVGEIAPLFFTEFGWNILMVVDRRKSGGVPYADVADGIREFLTERTIEATLKDLQKEGEVVFFPAEPDQPKAGDQLREGAPPAPGG